MYQQLQDREWLKEQYVDKLRTLQSIADEIGCNKATVGRNLKKLGIKRRKRTSKHKLLNDKEWLKKAYLEDGRTQTSIAREVGCTVGPVRDALRAMGIKTRSNKRVSEQQGSRIGEKAGNWRGGRRKIPSGYIYIYSPDHPSATKAGYVMEHRLVMEEKIGRYLETDEIVHHIDGVKDNNHPDNLQLTHNGKHISDHFKASHEVKRLRKRVAELEKELERYKRIVDEK